MLMLHVLDRVDIEKWLHNNGNNSSHGDKIFGKSSATTHFESVQYYLQFISGSRRNVSIIQHGITCSAVEYKWHFPVPESTG